MNVLDAAHMIAHEYDGGLEALSLRMGIRYKVLNGKVNPGDPGHVLGLVESVRMQQLANRFDILYAMAEELDHVCIKRPTGDSDNMAELISSACAEFGDFMRGVDGTLKDGKVTRNEAKRLQKELGEMIGAANTLYAVIAAKAQGRG